jgi:anti-sigma regulatory factor (Ser/Thr protein kinase)
MEIAMTGSARVAIEDASQVAEARRVARNIATNLGFDENRAEKVAIVVTEAATNILKHAAGGEILLSITEACDLELLALDRGPGMSNVEQCKRDGYSTGGSPGEGLGAIERLSDAADIYSTAADGTVLLARWSSRNHGRTALQVGALNVAKRGQEVCGDSWGVAHTEDTSTFLVADGLGHGYEASAASLEAVRTLRGNPGLAPLALLDASHKALRSSRGAAVAVARIDRLRGELTYAGVGNVAAQIYAGASRCQHLVSVNGTAGHDSPRLREFSYPWPRDGTLVMHSDGLSTQTDMASRQRLALHDPSLIAGVLYRDFSRGQDDSTVVVARAA